MDPVVAATYTEVPLENPPIVLALCQLTFNEIPELLERSAIVAVRDHLGDYPDIEVRDQQELQFQIGPPGLQVHQLASRAHVLRSPHHPWWVLLGPGTATLVTTTYEGRADFVRRVAALRRALQDVAGIPAVVRIAVRVVNRVDDDAVLDRVEQMIQPRFLGGIGFPVAPGAAMVHSLQDIVLRWADNVIRVRTGHVPPEFVPDPAVPGLPVPSWLLDLDASTDTYRSFDQVEGTAEGLAENIHHVFRAIVQDDFLRHFGGRP